MALLAGDLRELLAPFKLMTNKSALSAVYKSLLLLPDRVCGCSSNGMMEIFLEPGIDAPAVVDAAPFLALLDSLPKGEELRLDAGEGVLSWACGKAKGKLALALLETLPRMAGPFPKNGGWVPMGGFTDGLSVGALSCDSMSLASLGMHGLSITATDAGLHFCSSDNITVSNVLVPFEEGSVLPTEEAGLITLSPDAATLLGAVLAPKGKLLVTETEIRYWDSGTRLVLKKVAPLKHDLVALTDKYPERDIVVEIPLERIAAFIKRTTSIAESKRNSIITMRAANGQLSLEFADNTASGDEYYMVDDLELKKDLEIKLDAVRLARALEHVTHVSLDYVDRGVLLFLGDEPDFTYLVAGKK